MTGPSPSSSPCPGLVWSGLGPSLGSPHLAFRSAPHMLNYFLPPPLFVHATPLVCSRSSASRVAATGSGTVRDRRGRSGCGASSTLTANRRSRSRHATQQASRGRGSGETGGYWQSGLELLMLHIINLLCCCRCSKLPLAMSRLIYPAPLCPSALSLLLPVFMTHLWLHWQSRPSESHRVVCY